MDQNSQTIVLINSGRPAWATKKKKKKKKKKMSFLSYSDNLFTIRCI